MFTQLNVKTALFQTIHFIASTISVSKIVLFKTIQFSIQKQFPFKQLFSINTQFTSILPIDRSLSNTTAPGLSGPKTDGNERLLSFSRIFSLTGTSPSDCLLRCSCFFFIQPQPTGQCIYIYIYEVKIYEQTGKSDVRWQIWNLRKKQLIFW